MKRRAFALVGMSALVLAACGGPSKFKTYRGPEVTGIVVNKTTRKMFMVHNGRALKVYDVDLGRAPAGPKQFEGDGKTPEGTYLVDRRNPNSRFHLSLGISYPNAEDRAFAASQGKSPGGDIFIHGTPNPFSNETDWTWGCIAVTNDEIEEIYAMVNEGTLITIYP